MSGLSMSVVDAAVAYVKMEMAGDRSLNREAAGANDGSFDNLVFYLRLGGYIPAQGEATEKWLET